MNYSLLLLAHIICADQQIHSEEVRYLDELIKNNGADTATTEAIESILSQAENYPSLEESAKLVAIEERQHLLDQILEITYADGYLAPLEKIAVDEIVRIWKFPQTKVDHAIANAEKYYQTHRQNNLSGNEKVDLSGSAKLVKFAQNFVPKGLVKKIAEVAPSEIGQKIERLQREVLLAGPEYDEAVLRCAKIASEDYEFAKSRLERTEKALEDLQVSINRQTQELQKSLLAGGRSGSAKEVIKQINATKEALESKIIQQLQKIRASLDAKSRALSHFSITFMGKTKAGKSTLHAVVTGEGWNAIGVGKQRTTRYNRVYEWKNIRIIDTPGIGAPGGKSDEEVAESVIDESDVICYVVTNDSVQESEFKFLEVLEANAKPLIILMNLKRNLRDTRLLKGFLESPDKLFVMQGNNTLQGHFNRIRTYAEKHYRNNAFEIIPVMLLAAQMSKEQEHREIQTKLLEASRLQDFLNIIRESIVTNGTIRRSQTFLGSTAGKIGMPLEQINLEIEAYQHLLSELQKKRDRVKQEVTSQEDNARRLLQNKVKTIFQTLRRKTSSFAFDNYKDDGETLSKKWNVEVEPNKLRESLEVAVRQAGEAYNKEVAEILEEVGKDLQLMAKLSGSSFSINNTYEGFSLRFGGKILAIAGFVTSFIFPITGIAINLLGRAMGWIGSFGKSEDDKRREAAEKIEKDLKSSIDTQESQVIKQASDILTKQCKNISSTIDAYFGGLINGLEVILKEMLATEKKLGEVNQELNLAYSKRIVDYCQNKYERLTLGTARTVISSVQRDFGKEIIINLHPKFTIAKKMLDPKHQAEISKILQEKATIRQTKP
jgi:putative ribosome biogenesis GTPase RsgA